MCTNPSIYGFTCAHSVCVCSIYMHLPCVPVTVGTCQPLTAMPECSQTPRRQRPDYLADFTSGSSAENSCSSSDEEEEERRKAGGGGRGGEKREKKVSYDLGESKEKNLAERSGKAAGCRKVSENVFIRKPDCGGLTETLFPTIFLSCLLWFLLACSLLILSRSLFLLPCLLISFFFSWSPPSDHSLL